MQNDDWTEVGGSNTDMPMWDREGSITGQYTRKQTGVGQNNSNIYTLVVDGEETGVWGSTVLDSKFESIQIGMLVKIESLGKPAGKNYYDYKVFSKLAPAGATPAPAAAPVDNNVAATFPGAETAA